MNLNSHKTAEADDAIEVDLASVFRARRQAAGISQQQLAAAARVGAGTVRDLEQGRTSYPRAGSIARLALALGFSAQEVGMLSRAAQAWPGKTQISGPRPCHQAVPANGFWLQVLGPLMAWRDDTGIDFGAPKPRAVLGMLALLPGVLLHRETIIDALWAENPPSSAVNLVQTYVSRLRRALGPEHSPQDQGARLISAGTSYGLRATASQLDLLAFDDYIDRARSSCASGELAAGCGLYLRALGLWQGEPLTGMDTLRSHPAVVGLLHKRDAVVVEFASAAADAGLHDQALPHLQAMVSRDSLHELAHAQLMILLAGTGQQAAALRVYDELRLRLDVQLGVAPCPQLADAQLRVLRQEVPAAAAACHIREPDPIRVQPWTTTPRHLPFPLPHFTGRSSQLGTLTSLLDDPAPAGPRIAAIVGTAGVGKTALAVHWTQQVADRFPDGQLYINLHGLDPSDARIGPRESLRRFLDLLSVPAERIPDELDARSCIYRSLLAGKRMLVILDGARDEADVRPLLPGSPGCLVVVTSRNQLGGLVAAEGAYPLTLDEFTPSEAYDLLACRLGRGRVAAEPGAAAELARLCAWLPLALNIVAARAIARPAESLHEQMMKLRDAPRRLDVLDTGEPTTSIRATFYRSYGNLTAAAARVFRLLGIHPGPDISASVVASLAGVAPEEARVAIDELIATHILAERVPGRYACHDLLRAYAAERALLEEGEAELRSAKRRMLDHYVRAAATAIRLMIPGKLPAEPPPVRRETVVAPLTDATDPIAAREAPRPATGGGGSLCRWADAWSV